MTLERIGQELRGLGMTPGKMYYAYTSTALRITTRQTDDLYHVTKKLYPEVGRCYSATWKSVERGLRHAVDMAWETAPERLSAMIGCQLKKKPTPSEFLAILTTYLLMQEAAEASGTSAPL